MLLDQHADLYREVRRKPHRLEDRDFLELDTGCPASWSADVFGGGHHVDQALVERVHERLQVLDFRYTVVEQPVSVAELHDRDPAERIADDFHDAEAERRRAGVVRPEPGNRVRLVEHDLGGPLGLPALNTR